MSAPFMMPVSTMTVGVLADLAHHLGQQVERDGRAVELAAAVVREDDAVDAERR